MICYDPTVDGRPFCRVCGDGASTFIRARPETARCWKHQDRNPCAIEGCTRSRRVPESREYADDGWICSEHWRRYCPPRSARRRAYNAFFRQAKKRGGWDDALAARFWRFWNALVASARKRHAAGTVDVTEINKLFGWTDD